LGEDDHHAVSAQQNRVTEEEPASADVRAHTGNSSMQQETDDRPSTTGTKRLLSQEREISAKKARASPVAQSMMPDSASMETTDPPSASTALPQTVQIPTEQTEQGMAPVTLPAQDYARGPAAGGADHDDDDDDSDNFVVPEINLVSESSDEDDDEEENGDE